MLRRVTGLLLVFTLLASTGCKLQNNQSENRNVAIVENYVAAYNNRDLDAMGALMHPDIEWLNIDGGKTEIIANGKVDLVAQMNDYMSSSSATTSKLAGVTNNGRFLAVKEIAQWEKNDGTKAAQSALAVYEIDNGLVRRVWYYPAER